MYASGSFEFVPRNAYVHRLDLGLCSHPKEFFKEWNQNQCYPQGKNLLYRRLEGGSTYDCASRRTANPTYYRRSYSGPFCRGQEHTQTCARLPPPPPPPPSIVLSPPFPSLWDGGGSPGVKRSHMTIRRWQYSRAGRRGDYKMLIIAWG